MNGIANYLDVVKNVVRLVRHFSVLENFKKWLLTKLAVKRSTKVDDAFYFQGLVLLNQIVKFVFKSQHFFVLTNYLLIYFIKHKKAAQRAKKFNLNDAFTYKYQNNLGPITARKKN